MKACCTYSLTPVLALVGLVGLGVGGYNWVSTGCPLGSCETPAASMTATSTSEKTGDCAMCPAHDSAAVTTVADTSKADCSTAHECAAEAKGGDCCKGAGEACCQDAAMKHCSESETAQHCPEAGKAAECPMKKAQEEAKTTETKPTQPS